MRRLSRTPIESRTNPSRASAEATVSTRPLRLGWLRHRTRLAAGAGLWLALTSSSSAVACPYIEPTTEIAVDLGGGRVSMLRIYVETPDETAWRLEQTEDEPMSRDPSPGCSASLWIPLSTFPTSRVATRPAEVARSMHETMKTLGVSTCEVAVGYENDTAEEIAEHELCLRETFAFGNRKHWSVSSESFCWEPEEVEVVTVD